MSETPETGTQVPESGTAALARNRRKTKAAPTSPVEIARPGEAPAAVAGQTPVAVIASRTLVSSFNEGGLGRPVGGVWVGKPLIVETAPIGIAGVAPGSNDYVVAVCDASEQVVPPGCVTPTSRLLWKAGMHVRRDLHDAVMAAHAQRAAEGTAGVAQDAALPEGVDGVPVDVLTPEAAAAQPS